MIRVSICIITYQRLSELKHLLESLDLLIFKKFENIQLEVVVIDNDKNGSAAVICKELAPTMKWNLKYDIEVNPGIPFARNRALEVADKEADFIAFIDDDEFPSPTWLDELLQIQKSYSADVVSGPVIPQFKEPIPAWIKKFFERPRRSTGSSRTFAATNNVLISSAVLKNMDELFDERLAHTGGSDKHFFLRVNQAGYKIIWSDEALVYEWIPKHRATAGWILQRGYRLGNTDGLCELYIKPSYNSLFSLVFKAVGRIVLGILFIPFSILFGRYLFFYTLRSIYRGVGVIAGLLSLKYEEYRQHDQKTLVNVNE